MRKSDWKNGLIADVELLDEIDRNLFMLLGKLADDACEVGCSSSVHYFVSTQRLMDRQFRNLRLYMGSK